MCFYYQVTWQCDIKSSYALWFLKRKTNVTKWSVISICQDTSGSPILWWDIWFTDMVKSRHEAGVGWWLCDFHPWCSNRAESCTVDPHSFPIMQPQCHHRHHNATADIPAHYTPLTLQHNVAGRKSQWTNQFSFSPKNPCHVPCRSWPILRRTFYQSCYSQVSCSLCQ